MTQSKTSWCPPYKKGSRGRFQTLYVLSVKRMT
jgi:hypothetical protein